MNVCNDDEWWWMSAWLSVGGVEGGEQNITIFGDTHTSYNYLSTWSCEQLTYYLDKLTLWLLVWNFTLASYGMLGSQFMLRWMLSWSVEAIHWSCYGIFQSDDVSSGATHTGSSIGSLTRLLRLPFQLGTSGPPGWQMFYCLIASYGQL